MKYDKSVTIFQKNTETIEVTVLNTAGQPFALGEYTCRFIVKQTHASLEKLIDLTADPTAIVANKVSFFLNEDLTDLESGDYFYEVILTDGESLNKTVAQGWFIVNPSLDK